MYVDESGDAGLTNSPTEYFVLSGIIVHESSWRTFIETLVQFRRTMRFAYGLPIRSEIHASEYINSKVFDIKRHDRLAILRNLLDELAKQSYLSITNVAVKKADKPPTYDVFDSAWRILFQRFENTLKFANFPGQHSSDHGIIITDATNGKKLTKIVRRMAVHNYIPSMYELGSSRNVPILRVIEDPHGKDSRETLPIQAADVCAYFLMQSLKPNSYIKRQGAHNYFTRLDNICNKNANRSHPQGVKIL
mgnify:CR=1 FL=1